MKKNLYNKKSRQELLSDLYSEDFKRITISFYKYVKLTNLHELRNNIYSNFHRLKILGRIYIANEGINAQMSIPTHNINRFKKLLFSYPNFTNIQFKKALNYELSFIKLSVKVKKEIVAYKIPENKYDMKKVGKHLDYREYHKKINNGAIIVDIRNQYESEVGKFKNAITPNVDRSEELLPTVKEMLKGHENETVLLYCTGGIRCEKASSYLIKSGFKDVNQLDGGIIKYAHDIKKNNIKSKFIGKNYVFDNRLGENVTEDIISRCHQCNSPSNKHIDCKNQSCHILFIQCDKCSIKFNNCCSKRCSDFILLPKEQQKKKFKEGKIKFTAQISNKIKPRLNKMNLDELT